MTRTASESSSSQQEPLRITEHDEEPIRGLPGELPEGEYVLWQGAPALRSLARRVLHTRKIVFYFALIIVWAGASALYGGDALGRIAGAALFTAFAGLVAIGLLYLYAYAIKRTTVYTLTNKRLVMRIGVAVSVSLNVPYSRVVSADFKRHRDGSGDLSLTVDPQGPRLGLYALWPHNRPWHWSKPEPTLRCVADADTAAMILRDQLMAAHQDGIATGASPLRVAQEGERKSPKTDSDQSLPSGAMAAG